MVAGEHTRPWLNFRRQFANCTFSLPSILLGLNGDSANPPFGDAKVCDGILDRFEQAAVPLAAEYGALPVVGIGHSCGALLQLLITCLFPDTPRAANALISFNNKPVQEAVPGFEDLILPLVSQVRGTVDTKSFDN